MSLCKGVLTLPSLTVPKMPMETCNYNVHYTYQLHCHQLAEGPPQYSQWMDYWVQPLHWPRHLILALGNQLCWYWFWLVLGGYTSYAIWDILDNLEYKNFWEWRKNKQDSSQKTQDTTAIYFSVPKVCRIQDDLFIQFSAEYAYKVLVRRKSTSLGTGLLLLRKSFFKVITALWQYKV